MKMAAMEKYNVLLAKVTIASYRRGPEDQGERNQVLSLGEDCYDEVQSVNNLALNRSYAP